MSEPAWVGLGGGEIDYVGNWSGATAYLPGQIVRYNGIDYLAVNPSVGQTPPTVFGPVGAGYGTSLPGSPIDGQEYTLVDSLTNPSYQWRFRWNAGSSSAYKWEFVGGTRARANVSGGEVTSSATHVDLTTVQSITAPRAGEYEAQIGAIGEHVTTANAISVSVGGNSEYVNAPLAGYRTTITFSVLLTATAGQVLKMQFASLNGGSATFRRRYFHLVPVRVA